ncbi:MAG: acetolactate synthase large subunit [Candidatus Acidiferrales bacterium]
MNGAESLVRTLVVGSVDTCFTNPGTSEMHIVAALDQVPEMRSVLGLFEGVVTGAADGYARMADKPACTLLHLGPGLANGLANLHNAGRARVPLLNIVGQHATHHLHHDTPLTSDIEALASPYSKWLRTSASSREVGRDAAEAIAVARTEPGQIATLIVPADVAWSDCGAVASPLSVPPALMPAAATIERAVEMLQSGLRTGILLAGKALYGEGLVASGRIAAATDATLLAPYPFARIERGAGTSVVERIPYAPDQAAELLRQFRQLILVGAQPPVAYFAQPNKNSELTPPDCEIHTLAKPGEDYVATLNMLVSALSAGSVQPFAEKTQDAILLSGGITLGGLAAVVAGRIAENAIVVDESMTSGRAMLSAARGALPHDWLACTGGSIGIAMPLAVGAAVACPQRRVLCLTADGSGMYTAQALWTMAREGLNVTTVVFANQMYSVLKREFANLGVGGPRPRTEDLFEIGRPQIDWVSLAKGMGVPARRISSLDGFARALQDGFEGDGPSLIEVPC